MRYIPEVTETILNNHPHRAKSPPTKPILPPLIPKQLTTPPTLLNCKLPLRLPQIILKAEERTFPAHMLLDTLNCRLLLLHAWASGAIRVTRARPPGLQVIRL